MEAGEPAARPKPKQPFLKRGSGMHKRINPAQQRRYVPKGGFVLQAEQQDDAHSKPPQAMEDSRPDRLGKLAQTADLLPSQAISGRAAKPASASSDPWDTAPASVGMRLMQQQSASLQQQADKHQHRLQGASSLRELQQQGGHTHAVRDRGTAGQQSDYVGHEGQHSLCCRNCTLQSPGAAQSCIFGFPACHADAARQMIKQAGLVVGSVARLTSFGNEQVTSICCLQKREIWQSWPQTQPWFRSGDRRAVRRRCSQVDILYCCLHCN